MINNKLLEKDSSILFKDMFILFGLLIFSSLGLYQLGKLSFFYPIITIIVSISVSSYIIIDTLKLNRIKSDLITNG
jgi:hypothetical protein